MFVLFEIYFPTFAQGEWLVSRRKIEIVLIPHDHTAVASFSPTAMAASVLFSTLFSFVIIFNGVVQVRALPFLYDLQIVGLTLSCH